MQLDDHEADRPGRIQVLVPWAERTAVVQTGLAPRPVSLAGTVVGIVDNGWRCMHVITDLLRPVLQERFGVAGVMVKQTSGSLTMSTTERLELQQHCSAVIVGIGACGSCSRWVLKDAVELEKAGTPTVGLYTRAFEVLATTLSRAEGLPELPQVVLPHPLNSLPEADIRAAAAEVIEEIHGAIVKTKVPA